MSLPTPVTCEEGIRYDLVLSEQPSLTTDYYVFNEPDADAALALVVATAPVFRGPLVRQSVTQKLFCDTPGSWTYEFEVLWSGKQIPIEGEVRRFFESRSRRERINRSLETIANYTRPGYSAACPDFRQMIAVRADGEVDGCEIDVDETIVGFEFHVDSGLISDAYLAKLARHKNFVNDRNYRGYLPGELRLSEIAMSETIKLDPAQKALQTLTLKFVVEPNFTSTSAFGTLTVGEVTGIEKEGHDFVWPVVQIHKEAGETTGRPRINHCVVERVYRRTNYRTLFGI